MTTFEMYMLAGVLFACSLKLLVSSILDRKVERQLAECRRLLDMCHEVRASYAPPTSLEMVWDGAALVPKPDELLCPKCGKTAPHVLAGDMWCAPCSYSYKDEQRKERECHKCHGAVPDPNLPGSYPVWCESCQIWVK